MSFTQSPSESTGNTPATWSLVSAIMGEGIDLSSTSPFKSGNPHVTWSLVSAIMGDNMDLSSNRPISDILGILNPSVLTPRRGSSSSAQATGAQPETNNQLKATETNEKASKNDIDASKANAYHMGEMLPASINKPYAQRSTSPPLGRAFSRKTSILRYQKLGTSSLRNEIYSSDADEDDVAQTKGKESIANANVPNEPLAFQGRATDRSAISGVGKCVDAAKTDRPAASANLQAKSKAQPEGATKMKTAEKGVERTRQNQPIQAKGSVAHEVSIVPPLFVRKDASGIIMGVGWTSDMLSGPDQPLNVRMRDPGVGLSGSEWAKIPYNFRLFPTDALARIWDFAYEPIIRKEVLEYKQQLKVAAKADQEMDWPNQLLIVLVDILEAELQEGAKHIVDASDIKTGESKTSTSDIISGYAGFLDIDLFIEAVYEIHNTLTDPSYNTTTAREALALSKGVKIDSHFTEILIELYEDLQPFELHSEMATTASDKERHDKKMLFLEQLENSFCKYKREESEQATGDATTGQVKGEEGEMLVEGSAVGKGKGKGRKKKRKSELLVDNAETDKGNGKGKERDMLVKGSTMGKGKSKDNDLKPDDAMTGKGKAKEKYVLVSKGKPTELLMEGPTTEKCKCKENDLPMAGNTVSKEKCKDCNHHHHEAIMHQVYSDLLSEAKALFLDPKSIGFHKAMGLNAEADSTTSSAPTHVSYALRDLVQSPLTVQEETRLIAYYKMYDHMENFIRPQTATLAEVDRLCRLLLSPDFFAALTPLIGELTWNRAIVQHPSNPMITSILQCTAHVRPTDDGRPTIFQFPPLPPGLASATPAVTTHTKKQSKKERTGVSKPKQQKDRIKVKIPFEDAVKVLEMREATIVAKMRDGVPLDGATAFADLMTIGHCKQYLAEKARLESVGGPVADMLAERQKRMAEPGSVRLATSLKACLPTKGASEALESGV